MGKVRIFSLAKQLGLQSKALMAALVELGVENVNPATAIDEATANAARELLAEQARQAREQAEVAKAAAEEEAAKAAAAAVAAEEAAPAEAQVGEQVPAKDDAAGEAVETKEDKETERYFRRRGPSRLDEDDGLRELERQLAELEAAEEEERIKRARAGEVVPLPELVRRPTGPKPASAVPVAPVVTVLGHVDHGKTTLLDSLRDTDVVSGESGGITQHIGASEVAVGEKTIVFVDTPGHEAFTAMRARGAMVTDVAILIIAADDGIMPQTEEAIKHAKAAEVPIIVAINKTDLPGANVDMVKQQLLQHELVPEDWGGDTVVVPISALRKEGLDDLLEMILLVSDLKDLWSDAEAEFAAIVIESSLDASQGTVGTLLVRSGVLRVGDSVVCGRTHGRVRRLRDWRGRSVDEMGPGRPVEVIGLTGLPDAGEVMVKVGSPKEARLTAEAQTLAAREAEFTGALGVSLRDLFQDADSEQSKQLNVILKGDVWGSVQALEAQLLQLDNRLEGIDINIISTGVGGVSESDIMLALASEAIVIAFHCAVDERVRQAAETEGVEVRSYDVIYRALEDIQRALLGILDPVYEQVYIGRAEVIELFKASRTGVIAGCRVVDGHIDRGAELRITRDNREVWRGELRSLRRFTDDAASVEAPNECGMSTPEWGEWRVGDVIEAWETVEKERKLTYRAEKG